MDGETVKELAKAASSACDFGSKCTDIFTDIWGGALKEYGATLHENAKVYRAQNLLKLQDKYYEFCRLRNLERRCIPVPASIGLPILESATLVDNEDLQDLWASLIASASDPNLQSKVRRSYVDILSTLDPSDAVVLKWLRSEGWNHELGKINVSKVAERCGLGDSESELSVLNLNRLGLLVFETGVVLGDIPGISKPFAERAFKLSRMGWSLLEVCAEKEEPAL